MSGPLSILKSGYVPLGRLGGALLLWHWTLPLGLYLLSGMHTNIVRWIAITVLTLGHEFGHAWWIKRYGARVTAIKVLPLGGLCEWEGNLTERQRSVVAWGGVMVQALVLALTIVAVRVWPSLAHDWRGDVVYAFTSSNLFSILFNLFPVQPLDGHQAWKLPQRWIVERVQHTENARIRQQVVAQRKARAAVTLTKTRAVDETDTDTPTDEVEAKARTLAEEMWKRARER